MGLCVCKNSCNQVSQNRLSISSTDSSYHETELVNNETNESNNLPINYNWTQSAINFFKKKSRNNHSSTDKLVLKTLKTIRTLFNHEREMPQPVLELQIIVDKDKGWIEVVKSMINVVPIDDLLGPCIILLLLEGWPLPTKESIKQLVKYLCIINTNYPKHCMNQEKCKFYFFSKKTYINKRCVSCSAFAKHRNLCVVLACLAEKLAGPISISLMNNLVLEYLISNLDEKNETSIILFSLIAIEKFAQTNENKERIFKKFEEFSENPLLKLEQWYNDEKNLMKHQIGFCAQWCLDNLFIYEKRLYSYETVKNDNLNIILNTNDVSEYLKISPNGLYARCDACSFESVRSTFQMDEGIWFYEVTLVTAGVMQIGFATKTSKFLSDEGGGIGDDEYSIAYDGCRQLIWFDSYDRSHKNHHKPWAPGDILGCLIDLINYKIIFYLNGLPLPPVNYVFEFAKKGFFAAASFMSFQECKFNFGAAPFKYPPKNIVFKSPNDHATLNPEQKIIYPKHIRLKNLAFFTAKENSCTLCYDEQASITLKPCNHDGFCSKCSIQLEFCPLCRCEISERLGFVI